MSSQQVILDRIAAMIVLHDGITLIDDRQYANTGTLRTLDADLNQVAAVTYEFQRNSCHFGGVNDRVAALWYDNPHAGTAAWVQRSIPDLVTAVVAHLTTGRNPS